MARKYMVAVKWQCFLKKKSVIEVLFSQELFLCASGMILLLLSLWPNQEEQKGKISHLHEIAGELALTEHGDYSKMGKATNNILLRPFLFQKIPVNLANPDLLQTVPGIGVKTAERIIAERKNGVFRSPADLVRVHGIGHKSATKLEKYLSFEGSKSVQQYDTN